uniref:Si:ch211-235m3.5 n=1 Tax=Oryzias sinensis TaxID=183150 RepID=A0A8C7Z0Z5_9TELE
MDQLRGWNFQSKGMDMEDDFYFDYGVEEITDYQDPAELVAALKQKEEEVILAAQLGKALLLENRQLKEQSDKLHEQYADKLEELEQGRHELQLKLEGSQSQWESQVGDLERDVRDLSSQVERLNQALSEAEKDKCRAQMEHSEQTHRLKGELNAVTCNPGICLTRMHLFQLAEAWQEVDVARSRSQQLQAQVEELQEEASLQENRSHGDASLLSELETADYGVSKEKVDLTLQHRQRSLKKKNMMETELVRSKNDMMSLNNQLLEAIQRKLELSQELEAWQDDIQIVINQQLKSQQQSEQLVSETRSERGFTVTTLIFDFHKTTFRLYIPYFVIL